MKYKKLKKKQLTTLLKKNNLKKAINNLFIEIKSLGVLIRSFEILLATIALTTFALILARFFILPAVYFMIIPATYLLLKLILAFKKNYFKLVEKKILYYDEKLSTIRDNFYKENEMIYDLEKDIILNTKKIRSSIFFNANGFYSKLFIIIVLVVFSFATAPITYKDIPNLFDPIRNKIQKNFDPYRIGWFQKVGAAGIKEQGDVKSTVNIYKEKSIYEEGIKEIPIELQTARDSLDLNSIQNVQDEDFEEYVPKKFKVEGSEYYEDSIPITKYEIVKKYFKQ